MDAKNLAVLQQLKAEMTKREIPDPVFSAHAVALLRALAESFKQAPRKAHEPRVKKQSEPKALQAAKSQKRRREEARTAAALRAELQANKEKALKFRDCRECGRPVHVGDSFPLYPICCDHCKRRYSEIDLGLQSRSGTEFSSVSVVAGGAPGLGKRR